MSNDDDAVGVGVFKADADAKTVSDEHGEVITFPIKFGIKLLIHSQTSTVAPLKFGNG